MFFFVSIALILIGIILAQSLEVPTDDGFIQGLSSIGSLLAGSGTVGLLVLAWATKKQWQSQVDYQRSSQTRIDFKKNTYQLIVVVNELFYFIQHRYHYKLTHPNRTYLFSHHEENFKLERLIKSYYTAVSKLKISSYSLKAEGEDKHEPIDQLVKAIDDYMDYLLPSIQLVINYDGELGSGEYRDFKTKVIYRFKECDNQLFAWGAKLIMQIECHLKKLD